MRNIRSRSGPTTMTINGEIVNRCFAKIVYRCRECLARLDYLDSGLACVADQKHSGFVHRWASESAELARIRAEEIDQIEAVYEIIDGQIVAKEK